MERVNRLGGGGGDDESYVSMRPGGRERGTVKWKRHAGGCECGGGGGGNDSTG